MIVTKNMMVSARTKRGGHTKAQVEMARLKTGRVKGVMKALVGMDIDQYWWSEFNSAKIRNGTALNPVPKSGGWEWKPKESDIPKKKIKGNAGNKKAVSRKEREAFYKSNEWRDLRYRVLRKYDARCCACGRTPKEHGVVVHVDHIIPRSKRVDLSLDFNNLQVLCEDCNLGKSNKDQTDWRTQDKLEVCL